MLSRLVSSKKESSTAEIPPEGEVPVSAQGGFVNGGNVGGISFSQRGCFVAVLAWVENLILSLSDNLIDWAMCTTAKER